MVAYAVDFVGEEVYTVVVRDAATGAEARTTPLGIRAGASPAASVCIGEAKYWRWFLAMASGCDDVTAMGHGKTSARACGCGAPKGKRKSQHGCVGTRAHI